MRRFALIRQAAGKVVEVPLTQAQYELAHESYTRLELAVAAEEKFDALARDFLDFESAMLRSTLETSFVGFGDGMEQMAVRRLLNRCLSNLMSAARAYIDYMRHAVKLLFSDDARSKSVLSYFSHQYDSSLAYRVLEALRNYSQHCGLPIHSVRYSTQVLREHAGAPMKQTISPMLDLRRLRSDGQFKASVLTELEAKGQSINLKSLVREYVACLAAVHENFRYHVPAIASEANAVLDNLTAELFESSTSEESGMVYAVLAHGDTRISEVPLTSKTWEYGEFLTRSNLNFMHVGLSFVSGEPEKDA